MRCIHSKTPTGDGGNVLIANKQPSARKAAFLLNSRQMQSRKQRRNPPANPGLNQIKKSS